MAAPKCFPDTAVSSTELSMIRIFNFNGVEFHDGDIDLHDDHHAYIFYSRGAEFDYSVCLKVYNLMEKIG